MIATVSAWCGVLALIGAAPGRAPQIQGDYIEARNADIYTGPCFSNGEVFIIGSKAVLAWKVNRGSWDGVDLAGLTVAAAVQGTSTLSLDRPEEARSVILVDEAATPRQRVALVGLAKHLAGGRLARVAAVLPSRMQLTVEAHAMSAGDAMAKHDHAGMPAAPRASFWAPGLAEILTRPLDDGDHMCGNEVVAYAPLSRGADVLPAYTLGHSFKGTQLDARWDDPNARSSFVGHFAD